MYKMSTQHVWIALLRGLTFRGRLIRRCCDDINQRSQRQKGEHVGGIHYCSAWAVDTRGLVLGKLLVGRDFVTLKNLFRHKTICLQITHYRWIHEIINNISSTGKPQQKLYMTFEVD